MVCLHVQFTSNFSSILSWFSVIDCTFAAVRNRYTKQEIQYSSLYLLLGNVHFTILYTHAVSSDIFLSNATVWLQILQKSSYMYMYVSITLKKREEIILDVTLLIK